MATNQGTKRSRPQPEPEQILERKQKRLQRTWIGQGGVNYRPVGFAYPPIATYPPSNANNPGNLHFKFSSTLRGPTPTQTPTPNPGHGFGSALGSLANPAGLSNQPNLSNLSNSKWFI